MMNKYHKKPIWEPVKMLKRPNYIQSSDLGHLKCFTPSYAKDPVNMYFLMGMEYQRIWNRERDTWEEELFPVVPATKKLIIRTVKRLHIKHPKSKEPTVPASEKLTMKKFQKVKTTRPGDKLAETKKATKEDDAKSTSQCSRCSCREHQEAGAAPVPPPTAVEATVQETPAEGQGDEKCCSKSESSHHSQKSPVKACPVDTPCPEK